MSKEPNTLERGFLRWQDMKVISTADCQSVTTLYTVYTVIPNLFLPLQHGLQPRFYPRQI